MRHATKAEHHRVEGCLTGDSGWLCGERSGLSHGSPCLTLSQRELFVWREAAHGKPMKAIAHDMGLGRTHAQTIRSSLLRKLGITPRKGGAGSTQALVRAYYALKTA